MDGVQPFHPLMTVEVFRFATKPHRTLRTLWLRLVSLDLTLCEGSVTKDDVRRNTLLKRQDCMEAIQQIASINDGAFWIECELDDNTSLLRCLGMRLCACTDTLNSFMSKDGVPSEEFVVHLSRTVWREAIVSMPPRGNDPTTTLPRIPLQWNPSLPLRNHQLKTLEWMQGQENRFPLTFRYDGNIRINDQWYIDTEHECITIESSPREAELRGGVCSDAPGSGKTATAIALMLSEHDPSTAVSFPKMYTTNASLVIVPLNLTSQWGNEIDKFTAGTRVATMLCVRDLRSVNMRSICEDYDIVLTTFNFIRSCRAYVDMVDAALNGRPRTRASLSSWSRQRMNTEPILEAIRWKRIIVDEIHQVFDGSRDLRALQLFDSKCLWGLSGTLNTEQDTAQHLYILLAREKSHHPNMLASLVRHAVKNHAEQERDFPPTTVHEVQRVYVTDRERLYVDDTNNFMQVEHEVRRLSFVDSMEGDESMEDGHMRKRTRERSQLVSQLEALPHSICVLERMCAELESELDSGKCAEGMRETLQQTTRELHQLQVRRDDISRRLERLDSTEEKREAPLHIGTKMRKIGGLVATFPISEPIVMFVQWKTMMRGTRTYLKGMDRRVFTLEGNSQRRASTLQEHLRGGILLLCLEDSFAGLHLPHARNIIFAHAIVAEVSTVKMLERQAIARCVREGQTSQVTVHSFMVADSAEERHWTGTHCTL